MKAKTVSWSEVDNMIDRLALIIKEANYSPTMIAAIPRGGWTVAALLAQRLNVRDSVAVTQKKNDGNRETFVAAPRSLVGEHVLVVEDSIETGKSLELAASMIKEFGAEVKTTALLISPTSSSFIPNFYLDRMTIPDFPWDL